jgi:ketosteroid isomerase-like protein
MADQVAAAIRSWFEALERCVGRVDYQAAHALFVDDAIAFGTRASLAIGRDALQRSQWSGIWPNVRNFRFNFDDLRCGADGDTAWAVVTWGSTGFDESGVPYDRPGRATVILQRDGGGWRARHTHFSLFPGTPGRTYGPKELSA